MSDTSFVSSSRQACQLAKPATMLLLVLATVVVYAFGVYHSIVTSTPLIRADAWWFVDAWLVPWQEGTFSLTDLWAKRHGNHAQPLAAILFLVNAVWWGLDFRIETMLAVALATVYGVLLLRLVRRYGMQGSRFEYVLVAAAIVCVLFSVNSKEKLSWSIVGLFYIGHLIGLALLLRVARQRAHPGPWELAGLAFVTCVLIDTTGVLWSVASLVVLLLPPRDGARGSRGRLMAGVMAILVAIASYKWLYAHLAPTPAGPEMIPIITAIEAMLGRIDSAWYAAMPPGAALLHPDRLSLLLGEGDFNGIVLGLSAACIAGHLWLWHEIWQRGAGIGIAVAAGLAIFAYLTVAGILLQRVPYHGFGYVLQPRYGVFFDLFWIAPILAWSGRAVAEPSRQMVIAATLMLMLPIATAVLLLGIGRKEIPWIQGWSDALARDTWTFMRDPSPSSGCHPELVLCGWPLPVKERILRAIEAGPYNLASPRFRSFYGYESLALEVEVSIRSVAPAADAHAVDSKVGGDR